MLLFCRLRSISINDGFLGFSFYRWHFALSASAKMLSVNDAPESKRPREMLLDLKFIYFYNGA